MSDFLTIDEVEEIFSTTVFNHGKQYYQQGRVRNLYYDPNNLIWHAIVKGNREYKVTIEEFDHEYEFDCDCPAFDSYWEPCKHVAAVLLKVCETVGGRPLGTSKQDEKELKSVQAQIQKRLTDQFIQGVAHLKQHELAAMNRSKTTLQVLKVEWSFRFHQSYYNRDPILCLQMKTGPKRVYVVKNIREFLQNVEMLETYPFTKNFTYDPNEHVFSDKDQEVIQVLQKALQMESMHQRIYGVSDYEGSEERFIPIPPLLAEELLLKIAGSDLLRFEVQSQVYKDIHIHQHEWPISLQLEKGESSGFQLRPSVPHPLEFSSLYGLLIEYNHFYFLSPAQQTLFKELVDAIFGQKQAALQIDEEQIEPFLSHVVPYMKKIVKLEVAEEISSQMVDFPLEAKMYVDREGDRLQVSLEYQYGDVCFNPYQNENMKNEDNGPILVRDSEKEEAISDLLEATSLTVHGKLLYLDGEEEICDFLYETIPLLENQVEIYLTNAVRTLILPERPSPVTNFDVDSAGNWLDVSFNVDGIDQKEIKHILQFAVEKKKYYRLPSGAFLPLDGEEFQTVQKMMDDLQLKPSQMKDDSFQVPLYRGFQLDEVLKNNEEHKAQYGKSFRRLLHRLKNPDELDFSKPSNLLAELRDYQTYGFQWLKTLNVYHLGGILADDMGLGKTLQSIAYLLSEKEEKDALEPALVVAPASLVYNWKNEFKKFAPSLKVDVMHGTRSERVEKLNDVRSADVLITSYPTLRQDMEEYSQHTFSTLFLDEVQAIKNYATKTAKAVRSIQADTRFALSGTPIENSIDEL
ncbi:hypothetical protein J8TS2_28440 [Lederbergia ruris]|uniref:Helicase SNF2 n=1 Tax=Lederbergia ruris TaxID=217495 RepID=A0ABQ4KKN8_9BACI|nr:hypothetical protein J8TS2_28440 [Lederbergia ruris]